MSHLVTIQTRMRDRAALAAACRRLGLAEPVEGSYERNLYPADRFTPIGRTTVSGLLVKLPGWVFPVAVQADGTALYDVNEGEWGDIAKLHKLLQVYAVEATKIQARRSGRSFTETPLPDGSIRLTISE